MFHVPDLQRLVTFWQFEMKLSSRMSTARGSSHPGRGVCLSACWDTQPPLGVGLENPRVWAWRPPQETCCKACWDTTCNAYWDTTPHEQNDRQVQNITLPQTSFVGGNKHITKQVCIPVGGIPPSC